MPKFNTKALGDWSIPASGYREKPCPATDRRACLRTVDQGLAMKWCIGGMNRYPVG
jgi:hypothetical protein